MKPTFALIIISSLLSLEQVQSESGDDILTLEQLKTFSDVQEKLYPDKGNLGKKVTAAFPGRKSFTLDEIMAVEKPKKSQTYDYKANLPGGRTKNNRPMDSFTAAASKESLEIYSLRYPSSGNLYQALINKYGVQPWYLAEELRDVEENGAEPKTQNVRRPADDPIGKVVRQIAERPQTFNDGFRTPRIRESWRDVIYDEDRSQGDKKGAVLSDLVGATLNFTRDGNAGSDTWTSKGALIFPWDHRFILEDGISLRHLAFAPSITIDKNDTSGDPNGESDSLLFRLGMYADVHLGNAPQTNLQVRTGAVYATDSSLEAHLPGYEIDLEPRVNFRPFPIGYRKIWVRKAPLKEDGSDNSLFDTQLRIWLHMEGGNAQRTGETWDPTGGSFFRLGPSMQFQAQWPKLVFGKDISLTSLASYLPAVSGSSQHDFYYKLSLIYDIFKDGDLNRKVSVNVSYEKGGLSFTREDVDQLTLGLGILF